MKKNRIIREAEIKKIVEDVSISISQRDKLFKKYFGEEYNTYTSLETKNVIKIVDEICKIHGENLIEHMDLEFR